MPQLVGTRRVLCGKRVDSILEGKFCGGCRSPVHHHCMKPGGQPAGGEGCPVCAGKFSRATVPALEQKPPVKAPLIPAWVSIGLKSYKAIKPLLIGTFAIWLDVYLILTRPIKSRTGLLKT